MKTRKDVVYASADTRGGPTDHGIRARHRPFVAAATVIVAARLPDLGGLVDDLFGNSVLPWILGAMTLACGLVIIAVHQYWHGPPSASGSPTSGGCRGVARPLWITSAPRPADLPA